MQPLRKLGPAVLIASALALPTLASADSPPTTPEKTEHKVIKKHKSADKSSKDAKTVKHKTSSDKPMH